MLRISSVKIISKKEQHLIHVVANSTCLNEYFNVRFRYILHSKDAWHMGASMVAYGSKYSGPNALRSATATVLMDGQEQVHVDEETRLVRSFRSTDEKIVHIIHVAT